MTLKENNVANRYQRLINWQAYQFENSWIGEHVQVPINKLEAETRINIFWSLWDSVFPKCPYKKCCERECLILIWPDERQTEKAPAAWYYGRYGSNIDFGEIPDAWEAVYAWLNNNPNCKDIPKPDERCKYKTLSTFFAFSGIPDPEEVDELADRWVVQCSPDNKILSEYRDGEYTPINVNMLSKRKPGEGKKDREDISDVDLQYYQKVAIIFTCNCEEVSRQIVKLAQSIMSTVVTNWTYDLEVRRSRKQKGEEDRQKFAHQIRGFIQPINGALKLMLAEARERILAESALKQLAFSAITFDVTPFKVLTKPRKLQWRQCVDDALNLALLRLDNRCQSPYKLLDEFFHDHDMEDLHTKVLTKLDEEFLLDWVNDPSKHESFICPGGLGDALVDLPVIWDDDMEEGLYTYILTQCFFHASVCATYDKVASHRYEGSYITVSYDVQTQTAYFENRALERVDFRGTFDHSTLKTLENKFNHVRPSWITYTPDIIIKNGLLWFQYKITFGERTI